MFLTSPDLRYEKAFLRLVEDYRLVGEQDGLSRYTPGKIDFFSYVGFLQSAAHGIGLPEGQVPYFTFWLVEGEEIVGITRIRLRLTAESEKNDGHIGYDIPPAQRRKGYGTALLRMSLIQARELGLQRVVLTCLSTNNASKRIIEKCGGRLLGLVNDDETGLPLCRYEVEMGDES
jgi:predicted acetyltransferase